MRLTLHVKIVFLLQDFQQNPHLQYVPGEVKRQKMEEKLKGLLIRKRLLNHSKWLLVLVIRWLDLVSINLL